MPIHNSENSRNTFASVSSRKIGSGLWQQRPCFAAKTNFSASASISPLRFIKRLTCRSENLATSKTCSVHVIVYPVRQARRGFAIKSPRTICRSVMKFSHGCGLKVLLAPSIGLWHFWRQAATFKFKQCGLTIRSTGPIAACRHLGYKSLAQMPAHRNGPVSSNVRRHIH